MQEIGQALLDIDNISRDFSSEDVRTHALQSVSLSVRPGEFVAIMGPSGCGKSTLLAILGLLDRPTAGRYRFLGHDTLTLSDPEAAKLRRENIGFVFQEFALLDHLTVYENIDLALMYQDVPRHLRKDLIETALRTFGIEHRRNHYPGALSGGQKQRVAIARAVATPRRLVLADEPTGNLDSANGREVIQVLRQLQAQGSAVIMVTHSEAQAEQADRVLRMLDGRIVDETRPLRTAQRDQLRIA
ncbi:MAG: ABC transporter ATP-binding protein [Hyphomonadaceae bacterium]|jgi:putative ABC transport system ATP-binding protein